MNRGKILLLFFLNNVFCGVPRSKPREIQKLLPELFSNHPTSERTSTSSFASPPCHVFIDASCMIIPCDETFVVSFDATVTAFPQCPWTIPPTFYPGVNMKPNSEAFETTETSKEESVVEVYSKESTFMVNTTLMANKTELTKPTDSTPDFKEKTSTKVVSNTVTNALTNTASNGVRQGFFHKSILIALITEIIIK